MLASCLMALVWTLAPAEPPAIAGQLVRDGKPAADALVMISHTRVENHEMVWLPRGADVGRVTRTDEAGRFSIPVTDTADKFSIICFGKDGGTASALLTPTSKPGEQIILSTSAPKDGARICRARVLDDAGKPIPGALVIPVQTQLARGTSMNPDMFLGAIRTGADGVAELKFSVPDGLKNSTIIGLGVHVRADGYASPQPQLISFDEPPKDVRLTSGCRVTGSIVANGAPLANAWIDLSPATDGGSFYARMRARTDDRGGFTINHVPAETEIWITGEGLASGARVIVVPTKSSTAADNETLDVGVLTAGAGRRIAGKVMPRDGAQIPKNSMITIAHDGAWIGWAVPIAEDGAFSFEGVPDGGPYDLNICAQGIMTSSDNAAMHPWMYTALRGMVTRDRDDIMIDVVPFAADRDNLQPRDKPMRGVNQEAAR